MFKPRKHSIQFFLSFCFVLLIGIFFFSLGDQVSAQADTFGVGDIDQNVALGNQSLTQTVVKIINVALGFLGIIAVSIVLYGGFIYMTSGGNEEKVSQAKKILVNGVIGLAIILSAWTITYFVLQKLGEATGAGGIGAGGLDSRCRDAEFANANPDVCFPDDFDGANDLDCAARQTGVLLVRGITPSSGDANDPIGMNNAKIRVLFNNALNQNDPKQVFDVYRVENGQEVTTTDSFAVQFVDSDPALLDAVFQAQDGSGRLPQGEYHVKVNKNVKSLSGKPLVEQVSCGTFPSSAKFMVNTDGVIDVQPPQIGPALINGQPVNPQGDDYPRGKIYNYTFNTVDDSGIGLVQFHITVKRDGAVVDTFDKYDIPKIADGSKSTGEDPFIARLQLAVPLQAVLFDEYTIDVTVFDIDGNTAIGQFQGIVVGAGCKPGDVGNECLNQDRRCTGDLQCPSRKCLNNQCVEWPVITNVNPRSGIWDGAPGNYVTIVGNYFGGVEGMVHFGYEVNGNVEWVRAKLPDCGDRDLWHDDSIIVMVPEHGPANGELRAVIKVTKADDAAQEVEFFDTTIDNHGPIPGPHQGRFIKNSTQRPGVCSVGVAAGHATLVEGATEAPINTQLLVRGNAFGNEAGVGKVEFNSTQAEVSGWSNDSIATRVPSNIQPGVAYVGVVQNQVPSNDVPFTVVSEASVNRPEIISLDPVTTTPKSFVTIFGKNFGQSTGEVFLAPDGVTNCRPGGALNRECILLNLQTCGDNAWSDTQIIAQIPGDTAFKKYSIIVERQNDHQVSQGENFLGIENGLPLPGICYFSPSSGPAPLPADHQGLKLRGINFSLTPKVYFSYNKSNPLDFETWLTAENPRIVVTESNAVVTTILSPIPVNAEGLTLTANSSSTIRLKNAEGKFSNAVVYSVNDCQNSPPMAGFQCCTEGPEKGFFKPNDFLCAGQTREAGYAWRFTTGKIPEIPQVIERCDRTPEAEPVFPSPAPSKDWLSPNELACVNQSVVVAFSLPEGARLEGATDPNKVKLFTCEENEGQPDCEGNNKEQVVLNRQLGDLTLEAGTNLIILDNPFRGASRFLPETWYHVEISKDIESVRWVDVAGTQTEERQTLLVKRPCSDETAYCFDFKTGSLENRCELVRAGVLPNPFTVDYLGVLQLPGRYDAAHVLNPPENSILYYKVWGAGSQDCSVLDVQGLGWQWSPAAGEENANKAVTERKINNDTRAKVMSLQNTVPGTVPIRAGANNDSGQLIVGQANLTIDLGEPKVTDFWPSCTESCIEAEMGARFSRQMMKNTLVAANVTLMKCNDELCEEGNGEILPVDVSVADYESFRFTPVDAENNDLLEKGVWYKVTLSSNIRGLGRLGVDERGAPLEANDQPGKAMQPFSWRFRTTDKPDGKCVADKVVVEPRNFVARSIGERTAYNSQPRTAPNKCSRLGQNLNPWMYGWDWKTVLPQTSNLFAAGEEVASVSNFEVQGKIKPFCGITCMPNGSNISSDYNGEYPLCGNGTVDPGEDCDIANPVRGESLGVSCSLNCLRPGNTNAGGDAAQKQCGNGVVDTDAGEECDPKDIARGGAFCNNTCLWIGGVSQIQSTTGTPWCGSRDVVFGKDCDINSDATTTPAGSLGCSSRCLHLGTRLSKNWCSLNSERVVADGRTVAELPECKTSVSVCGNERLELGEECEYFSEDGTNGVYVALREGTNPIRVVTPSRSVCSDRCLLGNICTLNQIPTNPNGPRCQSGTEGCSEGCHVVGSSVTYQNPSFCGDAKVETGEHLMCENLNIDPAQRLGQSPLQMVTAIGNGRLNEETKSQNADILAAITKKRGENNTVIDSPEKPVGRESYTLQCGFSETSAVSQGDLLTNRDGNMERAVNGAWEIRPFGGETITAEKVTEALVVHSGVRSMRIQGSGGVISQRALPVQAGKTYRIKFFYKANKGNIWAFPFTQTSDAPDNFQQNLEEELNNYVFRAADERIPVDMWDQWTLYERVFVAPDKANLQQVFGVSLRFSEEQPGNKVDFYVDDFVLEEVSPLLPISENDCPNNVDNSSGVSTNSCCYSRPYKVTTYPEHGQNDVCQNTVINVQVNDFIDKKSLPNNIILASRHSPNFECGANEEDITEDVFAISQGVPVAVVQNVGFFEKIWNHVKHFFVNIFGIENAYAGELRGVKWCGSRTSFTSMVTYESSEDMKFTTSTISLSLKNSLLKNTHHAVVLIGGKDGLKNLRGVGLMAPGLVEGKHQLADVFSFETGEKICKLESIHVEPSTYLFEKPNTTSTFTAVLLSSQNSQRIQPIPNVYSWEMFWMPANNPLFEIPVSGTPADVVSIDIRSKNLEGTINAAALARVTVDVSNEDNQTGRVFSAPFELTARFCENPWPPKEYFPYEDGVTFGSFRNNDGVGNEGNFTGSENLGVEVDNLPDRGQARTPAKAHFNFSFSYCADSNLAGNKQDDLPYLKPLVFGNFIGGSCVDAQGDLMHKPGPRPALNLNGDQNVVDNTLIGCTFDIQCQQVDRLARCRNSNVVPDNTLTEGVWKKFLFVNDKNDDAIGLQIVQNSKDLQTREPIRRTAKEWYEANFTGEDFSKLRTMTIAGYDAVFDGKSYYINALNQTGDLTSNIYNNIYIFSINNNAQADTKKVFEQIMTSLKFNINVSDMGYCLAENADTNNGGLNQHQTLLDNADRLSAITDQACQTDFDCRDADGLALATTNGVCSNAKTKLLRDWGRLSDIKVAQRKLESYKLLPENGQKYPQLESGTFIPGYTNSMWGSWDSFGTSIGGSLVDPINKWSRCGDYDAQTCWDATTSMVHCPFMSSITEYEKTDNGYKLHIPFEYFSLAAPVNPVVSEILGQANIGKLTTEPWCRSDAVIQAVQGQCGNGAINVGEDCDPVGVVERGNIGSFALKYGVCKITESRCLQRADCPQVQKVPRELISGVGVNNNVIGVMVEGIKEGYCTEPQSAKNVQLDPIIKLFQPEPGFVYKRMYSCDTTRDCIGQGSVGPGSTCIKYRDEDLFDAINADIGVANVQCMGAEPAEIRACDPGTTAPRVCSDQCKFEYGMCTGGAVCGNGKLEAGEICDSGALNGTYGRCAGRASIAGEPEMECKAYHPQYCGNGSIDRDGNKAIEMCDYVPNNYIILNYNNGTMYGRFALSSYGKFVTEGFCDNQVEDAQGNCPLILNLTKDFVEDAAFDIRKRCHDDKSIICRTNDDCIGPSRGEGIVDVSILSNPVTLSRFVWAAHRSNFGACELLAANNEIGSNYGFSKNISCTESCSVLGEYCGDGVIQNRYESCDDRNNSDGDGCSKYCQAEGVAAAPVNQPAPVQACGNGRVENAETCDMGEDNGRICEASQYGRSCSYCSADCRNVLTVDPLAFCGDSRVDLEAEKCDVIRRQGEPSVVTVVSSTPQAPNNKFTEAKSCPVNYKGEYSCSNQCQTVGNNCVQCGRDNKGTVLALTVLNPMASTVAGIGGWFQTDLDLYVKRDVKQGADADTDLVNFSVVNRFPVPIGGNVLDNDRQRLFSNFLWNVHGRLNLQGIFSDNHNYHDGFINSIAFNNINDNINDGLVSNDLCKNDYGFVPNIGEMNTQIPSNWDVGHYLTADKADFFPLDFSSAGQRVENELIFSPAVSRNTLRVVLRWEKEVNVESPGLVGVIKNTAFSGESQVDSGNVGAQNLADGIELSSLAEAGGIERNRYWIPTGGEAKKLKGSVFVHSRQTAPTSFFQSMTLDMNGGDAQPNEHKSYAYFVKAINAHQGAIPMGQLTGKKVFVDVYVYHEGQIPKYSIYKPAYTFALADSILQNGNAFAEFWHVFNLVFIENANEANGGHYELRPPTNLQGQAFQKGKLATDDIDLMCYVQGEPCHVQQP